MSLQKAIRFLSRIFLLLPSFFLLDTCERLEIDEIVKIVTRGTENITFHEATLYGAIVDFGGKQILQHGHCWATHAHPSVYDDSSSVSKLNSLAKPMPFSSYIKELMPGTIYYYCAYCFDGTDTYYGDILSFTTHVTLTASISTGDVTKISTDSALCGGYIYNDGGENMTARGVCWSTTDNPTVGQNDTTIDGNGVGPFTSILRGLISDTTYYVRAYATNKKGTAYGKTVSFLTRNGIPVFTTNPPDLITATSARSGGNISDNGGLPVLSCGICWDTASGPDLTNLSKQSVDKDSFFIARMTELKPERAYFVRAYVTNSMGTFLGNEVIFSTGEAIPPALTTDMVSEITAVSAVSGGNILSEGSLPVTLRGVCWNTSPGAEVTDFSTKDGQGTGTFTSNLTGLIPDSTYYVRAYAINSMDTIYSKNEWYFTTKNGKVNISTNPICCGTYSTISIGGTINDDGGYVVTNRGICWSAAPGPETDDSIINSGTGTGTFSCIIPDLILHKRYYFRAFATNEAGTFYGEEIDYKFYVCGVHTVSDFEGNEYNTIQIDKQCWMKENLKTAYFADGTSIEDGTTAGDITGNFISKYWFVYNDEEVKKDTFGLLYTWAAAMNEGLSSNANPSGIQGICPNGWHLPSNSEWSQLIDFLGGTEAAGGKMKETGTQHWISPNAASNESGFTALAAGLRYENGGYSEMKIHSLFHTATEVDANLFFDIEIYHEYYSIYNRSHSKADGLSVRCLKN